MDESFLKLLQICDSTFPVGAFTLSNGLETYVQKELITKAEDLKCYLKAWLHVQRYNDLAVAAQAYDCEGDAEKLLQIDGIAASSKVPMEIREGSRKMCVRFLKLMKSIGVTMAKDYAKMISDGEAYGQYPVAFGIYTNFQKIAREDAVTVYAYNLCSSVVTGCVKLVPLSQTDGQRVLYEMLPDIQKAARESLKIGLDEIGLSLPGLDIRAMQHERLETRQFLS
jgi:urease accessory protein